MLLTKNQLKPLILISLAFAATVLYFATNLSSNTNKQTTKPAGRKLSAKELPEMANKIDARIVTIDINSVGLGVLSIRITNNSDREISKMTVGIRIPEAKTERVGIGEIENLQPEESRLITIYTSQEPATLEDYKLTLEQAWVK